MLTVDFNATGLEPGMRVLDLGCGKGLSSIFLAKEFGVQVWAADLWTPLVIDPTAWFHKGTIAWMVARLRPGTTLERSRTELATLFPRMREALELAPDRLALDLSAHAPGSNPERRAARGRPPRRCG